MSLIDPLSCGFAKVAIFEMLTEDSEQLRKALDTSSKHLIYTRHLQRLTY